METPIATLPPDKAAVSEPKQSAEVWKNIRKVVDEGRYEEALSMLAKLRESQEEIGLVYYWTGMVHSKSGLWKQAWRQFYLASLHLPNAQAALYALKDAERELMAMPVSIPTQKPADLQAMPDEEVALVRDQAETAMRAGRYRLANGLAQKLQSARPKDPELILFALDSALKADSVFVARKYWDLLDEPQKNKLSWIVKTMEEFESKPENQKNSELAGLDKVRWCLDEMLLGQAMELLSTIQVKPSERSEVLWLRARLHILQGEKNVAAAYIHELSSERPMSRRFLENLQLLEARGVSLTP